MSVDITGREGAMGSAEITAANVSVRDNLITGAVVVTLSIRTTVRHRDFITSNTSVPRHMYNARMYEEMVERLVQRTADKWIERVDG